MDALLELIEELRWELYLISKDKSLTDKEVIIASQKLDAALNQLNCIYKKSLVA